MSPRLVVFGWGNPSRSDDALGPALLERAEQLSRATALDVRFVPAFQLAPEHALELASRDLALFIDASRDGAPVELRRVGAADATSFTSHTLSPEGVLELCRQLTGTDPPPAFVLAVRGASFELGEGLSATGRVHLEAAWDVLSALLARPERSAWEARARGPEEDL